MECEIHRIWLSQKVEPVILITEAELKLQGGKKGKDTKMKKDDKLIIMLA